MRFLQVLVVSLVLMSEVGAAKKSIVLTTHNLSPYGSFPNGVRPGLVADESFTGVAVDRVRCAARAIDYDLKVVVVPWKRAQANARAGSSDGFFAASQKNTRDEYAVLSEFIAEQKWQWYLLKDNKKNPNDPEFKSEAMVAGFVGSNMLSWMEKNKYKVGPRPLDTRRLLNTLLAGRVDAILANNLVMDVLIKKQQVEDKLKFYVAKDKPLGVYFTKLFLKKNAGFLDKFNKAVRKCKK